MLFSFIKESPRWLLEHHRFREADLILMEISKINGKKVENLESKLLKLRAVNEVNSASKKSYWHLFPNWRASATALTIALSWYTNF